MSTLIITDKTKKFGDVEKGETIFYLDPHLKSVEPCYVMGVFKPEEKPDQTGITVLLVPKDERNKPINNLDVTKLRKFYITLPKNISLALVGTIPPTLYATTEEELKTWLKFH